MILQMRACHVPQYMPPVSTKTIAEHVCGHIATAQEAVCDSGQSTEHYIQIILLLCNYYTNYSAITLELRDRVVGSGPAQQAMLSEGSDPANPPKQTFELN